MNDTAVLHRIYLKQVELCKRNGRCEILPAAFNYQGLIVVDTGLVQHDGLTVVFQTHSCGCGPQPTIRGGLLAAAVSWRESDLYQEMAASANPKDAAAASANPAAEVFLVRRPGSGEEKATITAALKKNFGPDKKIGFF